MAKKKNKGNTRGRGGNTYNNLRDEKDGDTVLNSPNRSSRKKKKKNKSAVVSHDDTSFRKSLREDGTKSIREMASDGNCLFRSISDQLLGDYGEQHSDVRRKLCDFLETKEDEFIHFLFLGKEEDAEAETFEDYVTMMREDGEWGGNLELVIASQYYRRNIVVYSAVGAFSIECEQETNSGNDLLVSYHENDHYNSVHDAKRPVQKLQLQKVMSEQAGPASEHSNTAHNHNNHTRKKEAKVKNGSTGVKGNAPNTATSTSTSSNNPKSQLAMRRNELCSCGSALRYKKCCMETDKSLLKVQKWKEKNGLVVDSENKSNDQKDEDDHDHKDVAEGGIKLLKI